MKSGFRGNVHFTFASRRRGKLITDSFDRSSDVYLSGVVIFDVALQDSFESVALGFAAKNGRVHKGVCRDAFSDCRLDRFSQAQHNGFGPLCACMDSLT